MISGTNGVKDTQKKYIKCLDLYLPCVICKEPTRYQEINFGCRVCPSECVCVVWARYLEIVGEPNTFLDIAGVLGVTQQGAQAIYNRALEKIQKHVRSDPKLLREWTTCLTSERPNLPSPKIPEANLREFD